MSVHPLITRRLRRRKKKKRIFGGHPRSPGRGPRPSALPLYEWIFGQSIDRYSLLIYAVWAPLLVLQLCMSEALFDLSGSLSGKVRRYETYNEGRLWLASHA